jgi:hypothetical protein
MNRPLAPVARFASREVSVALYDRRSVGTSTDRISNRFLCQPVVWTRPDDFASLRA